VSAAHDPAPEVVRRAGLDATGAEARPASDPEYRFDPQATVAMLADALARLHALDPGGCEALGGAPGETGRLTLEAVVARAEQEVAGTGSPGLDAAYGHMEPGRLLEVLTAGAVDLGEPDASDLVLTHGAVSLSALRCHQGRALGFRGWSSAAVADRHRDLARAATVVAGSLGPMLVPELFERYGRRPDPRRLDWWALADQLTGDLARDVPDR
jgi:aminoglycoside phosphotransferase